MSNHYLLQREGLVNHRDEILRFDQLFEKEKTLYQTNLKFLISLIGLMTLFAAGMGFLDKTPGEPFEFTSHRGEKVMING